MFLGGFVDGEFDRTELATTDSFEEPIVANTGDGATARRAGRRRRGLHAENYDRENGEWRSGSRALVKTRTQTQLSFDSNRQRGKQTEKLSYKIYNYKGRVRWTESKVS